MTAARFRRLSRAWYEFPGRARVAVLYEEFLNGILREELAQHGVTLVVRPVKL